MISITLDGHPPSPNRTRAATWHGRSRSDETWRIAAYYAAVSLRPPEPFATVMITITVFAPDKHRRDPDNMVAACKPCIDGLVDAGVLVDDSFAVVRRLTIQAGVGTRSVRFDVEPIRPDAVLL